MKLLSCVSAGILTFSVAVQPSIANTINITDAQNTVVTKSAYQEQIWPLIRGHVPNAGDRKSLLCVFFSETITPYNILLQELYRESFGDGVAEAVGKIVEANTHDYTYQFHLQALDNGSVRIHTLDSRDGEINHNYIVDFYQDETFDYINYGRRPQNEQSEHEILQIYIRFLPSILQKQCSLQGFWFLES